MENLDNVYVPNFFGNLRVKKFENWSTFVEIMKSQVFCFLRHSVYHSCAAAAVTQTSVFVFMQVGLSCAAGPSRGVSCLRVVKSR